MLDVERKYNIAFWTLNVTGWILLYLLDVFIAWRSLVADTAGRMWHLSIIICGFGVTVPLRYFYRSVFRHTKNVWCLVTLVLVACFVATNVWNLAKSVTYIPFDPWDAGALRGWEFYFSGQNYLRRLYNTMWVLLVWSILYFALKMSIEWWSERKRMEEATALAQNAQIEMLRYQMNPHFLFNSLNSIRSIIDEDQAAARAMISDLAEFLRYSLVYRGQRDVPLSAEIEAVRNYLAIEKRRFEDNLDVDIDIPFEPDVVSIPCFIIQPLVENAIKHGRQTSRLPLRVRINCTYDGGRLVIRVSNTGALRNKHVNGHSGTGAGLENVRKRLRSAYPGRHRLTLCEQDGWVTAQIEIVGESGVKK